MNSMQPLPGAPFTDHVGVHSRGVNEGIATSEVDLAAHHMNRIGTAHGGLIATLLDNVMVNAARAAAGPEARLATIEMKLSFLRGGRGRLRATAKCVHSTGKLAFCEGEVHDDAGKLIATASSTLQYVAGSAGDKTTQSEGK
jgi:uncharacterized protein (TIGR00369 family)